MRKYLFKGKSVTSGNWVIVDFKSVRQVPLVDGIEVYPESVGQFVGVYGFVSEYTNYVPGVDKEVPIFEGDLVWLNGRQGVVRFFGDRCAFGIDVDESFEPFRPIDTYRKEGDYFDHIKVIGHEFSV